MNHSIKHGGIEWRIFKDFKDFLSYLGTGELLQVWWDGIGKIMRIF